MSLSLSKFKILKRANIFWIILLSVILLLAIGYQGKAMATSCADCSRCPGARVYGNIYDANTGGGISGATVTVSTTATSGVQCPSTSSSVHGWCGPKSGSTTSNSAGYYNFARVDGLYCFVNCGWGYSAPWRLSVSHPNYSSNSTTFSPTNGSEIVVNLRLTPTPTPPPPTPPPPTPPPPTPPPPTPPPPTPSVTCWSCNTNTYTCSSQSYSGYYCPSGTYSTLSSCQNNCQQATITCWSCNTSTYTCSSQSYSGYYCPSGTYSSLSSCQSNCQQASITCWSCNTSSYTCSSQSYSGYYCPSGTYSSLSSCQSNCQASLYYVLNISKTVRNITDNTTFQESVAADPLERVEFNILITSTGSTGVQSVIVKDSLPLHITYQNNLKIDGVSSAGDILTGLNLGTISPGQSKVITFEAQVSSEDQFIYGITTLTNAAIAYNVNTAKTDTAQIIVPRKAVAGAATEVKTGIVNRALDYILFPLIITFIIILVFKNYLVFLNEWFEKRKNGAIEYRANRALKKVIFGIKSRERS